MTDSAAAGTAIHSGLKAKNGSINVLPDGEWAYTIGQAAQAAGKSVGVLSTARMTHATPASVYGHDADRDAENSSPSRWSSSCPRSPSAVALATSCRTASVTMAATSSTRWSRLGYTNVTNAEELAAVDTESREYLLGLFTNSHMSYEVDRAQPGLDEPSLAEMTAVALDVLDNDPEGFFVSIEAGRIDHACHDHDITGSIWDTLAFDEAVQVALDYQAEHPDVLVVATADHETGGLSLGHGTEYFTTITSCQA